MKEIVDGATCPKCGRKALSVERWPTGEFAAVHGYDWMEVQSAATGAMVRCEVAQVCRGVEALGKVDITNETFLTHITAYSAALAASLRTSLL